jgi:hypothetical protein
MYELSQPLNPDLYGVAPNGVRVLEGMGCGMGCAGMGGMFDGSGIFGTGIFASSDVSTWGYGEGIAVAFGLFVLYSVFSTTSRGVSKVSRKVKYVAGAGARSRQAKAAKLRAEARMLEGASSKPKKGGGGFF